MSSSPLLGENEPGRAVEERNRQFLLERAHLPRHRGPTASCSPRIVKLRLRGSVSTFNLSQSTCTPAL
jgi:hypothetical protein